MCERVVSITYSSDRYRYMNYARELGAREREKLEAFASKGFCLVLE